jgi:hypothetical protein
MASQLVERKGREGKLTLGSQMKHATHGPDNFPLKLSSFVVVGIIMVPLFVHTF